ncbi:MAG: putative zinc metalloprotease Rip3 [Acidimicrobiia bacterium]
MHESIRLGTVRGIAIGLNWSVLAVAGLIAYGLADGVLPEVAPGYRPGAYWAVAIGAVLCFFASLLAHELGHSIVAQGQGVVVEGITLWLFGGVAKLRNEAHTHQAELKIATAGPAVSVALALVFAGIALAADTAGAPELTVEAFTWLALINGMLAVFNLAPGAPLDGGRILHALVWRSTHDRNRATRVSTGAGRVFGYLLVGLGILMVLNGAIGGIWLALVGWFVISAARAEATHALLRGALGGVRVRDVMSRDPHVVPEDQALSALLDDAFLRHHWSSFPVVNGIGDVTGLVTLRRVRHVAPGDRERLTAGDVAVPIDRCVIVAPDEALIDALEQVGPDGGGDGRMLVFEGGHLVGIVSPTDVHRALRHVASFSRPAR